MEDLLWILPLLVCPLGVVLMGAVVWVAAKLGVRSSERSSEPAGEREREAGSAAAPEAA
jgi:hypothetical protein